MIHVGIYYQSVKVDFQATGMSGAPLTITEAGDGPVRVEVFTAARSKILITWISMDGACGATIL